MEVNVKSNGENGKPLSNQNNEVKQEVEQQRKGGRDPYDTHPLTLIITEHQKTQREVRELDPYAVNS